MRWSIKQGADGVITDDPKRFLEVCDEWEHGKRAIHFSAGQWFMIIWVNLMILLFGSIFWWRFRSLPGAKPRRRPEPASPSVVDAAPGVSATELKEDQ